MSFEWADPDLSARLSVVRAAGESQQVEFKEEIPDNARKIASEVAAFATSGGGSLFIGISDSGELKGLVEGHDAQSRDSMIERRRGSIRSNVQPDLQVTISWCVEQGTPVIAIQVPEQTEPVFYYEGRPYIRDHTSARRATPSEVVERVRSFDADDNDPLLGARTSLAQMVNSMLAWFELEDNVLFLNPTLDSWRWDCKTFAGEIESVLIENIELNQSLVATFEAMAKSLRLVSEVILTLGSSELQDAARDAKNATRQAHAALVEKAELTPEQLLELRSDLQKDARRVHKLADKADTRIFHETDEVRSDAGEIGKKLVELSFYGLHGLGPNFTEKLRQIGLGLWSTETRSLYCDGGLGLNQIVREIKEAATRLEQLSADTTPIS